MKNIGFKGPRVAAENLIYFGVRDTESGRQTIEKQK
jgi:arginase